MKNTRAKRLILFFAIVFLPLVVLGCSSAEETVPERIVEQVIASPPGGGFDRTVQVELSYNREGYSIYYTTDTNAPNAQSIRYEEPIVIDSTTLLNAVAINDQDPADISPFVQQLYLFNAITWLDAAAEGMIEVNDENRVSKVLDKSGNDYHAVGVGSMPLFVQSGIHQKPVFRLDRSGGLWQEYSMGAFKDVSLYFVHERPECMIHDSQYARIISSIADPDKNIWVLPNFHVMAPTEPNNNNHVPYEVEVTERRFSNIEAGPLAVGFEAKMFVDYSGAIGSGAFSGDVGELIMVEGNLSGSEHYAVLQYLRQKWGVENLVYEAVEPQVVTEEAALPSVEERLMMVEEAAMLGDAGISILIDALSDDSAEVIWEARTALQQIGLAAVDPLVELLEDVNVDWPARWSAIRVLGRIGDSNPEIVAPHLIAALTDSVPSIRSSAASNLGRLAESAVVAVPSLVSVALHDLDVEVRVQAIDALGKIGKITDEVLGAIGLALGESELNVALAAQRTLRNLGADRERIAYVLMDFLKAEVVSQPRILNSFQRIGAITVDPLVSMLETETPAIRSQIARILSRIMPASVPVLMELTGDEESGVRRAAISALGKATASKNEVAEILSQIVTEQEEDAFLRYLAIRALFELDSNYIERDNEIMSALEQLNAYRRSDWYVSPAGDDSWSGRYKQPLPDGTDGPFATLERAREEVNSEKAFGTLPDGGVSIWIGEGVYFRDEPFIVSASDSGMEGAPIVYRASPGEEVVFTGGAFLEPEWFTPVADESILSRIICTDTRSKVLQLDLAKYGVTDYGTISRRGHRSPREMPAMELFIDGQRMTLARWPNEGQVQMDRIVDPGPKIDEPGFTSRGGTFTYTYNRPHLWSEAEDIWVEGIFGYSWVWSYNKVESIDTRKREITLAYGEVSGIFKQWYADHHVFENLLEEIDVPGEYYIDRDQGILYLYPPIGFREDSRIAVSISTAPLIQFNNASHVEVRDVHLTVGRHIAVNINGGENVSVASSVISNFTNGGISVSGDNHSVTNCHIYSVGAFGIRVGGGDRDKLTEGGNLIYNNKIHDIAYYTRVYNPAISVAGVGHRIINNVMFNTPHMAITLYGNDHRIEYNEFHRNSEDYSDMGAIYANLGSNQDQRGTMIYRNYFHHIGLTMPGVKGIYLDDGSSGITMDENIFYRVNAPRTASGAIINDTGHYNLARNNIFIDCPMPYAHSYYQGASDRTSSTGYVRMQQAWAQMYARYDLENMPHIKYPGILDLLDPDSYYDYEQFGRTYPRTSVFSGNLAFNPTVPLGQQGIIHVTPQYIKPGVDISQLLTAENNYEASRDPGFVDWRNADFRLKEDASVFQRIPGFPQIPFDKMGLVEPVGPFSR